MNLKNSDKDSGTGFQPVNPWISPSLSMQRRHLPHLCTDDATYFVTFRCRDGLRIPEQARREVLSAILHWNGNRIDLDAAVVMTEHVHLIFRTVDDRMGASSDDRLEACPTISKILHSIKSYSANRINKILGRDGAFWQDENFDHIIRNGEEWQEKIAYIIENPCKKELAARPEDYKWLWVRDNNE